MISLGTTKCSDYIYFHWPITGALGENERWAFCFFTGPQAVKSPQAFFIHDMSEKQLALLPSFESSWMIWTESICTEIIFMIWISFLVLNISMYACRGRMVQLLLQITLILFSNLPVGRTLVVIRTVKSTREIEPEWNSLGSQVQDKIRR